MTLGASMGRMPNDDNSPGGISTRLTSPSADFADPPRPNDYDSFAEAYSSENEVNLHNAYYERPAMLALAGDVAGRRILDAGCGSGPLSAALRDRGATVTGFDKSAGMLELARRRLGDNADLQVADLGRPLPAMIDAFTAAGFRIAKVSEPLPAPDTPRELLPDFLQDKPPGSGFLCFLFFVLLVSSC